MDRSEQERERRAMQEKINKQYIEAKVNPIIEPMTIALFSENQVNSDVVSIFYIHSNQQLSIILCRSNSCLITSSKTLEIDHPSMRVRGWNLNI